MKRSPRRLASAEQLGCDILSADESRRAQIQVRRSNSAVATWKAITREVEKGRHGAATVLLRRLEQGSKRIGYRGSPPQRLHSLRRTLAPTLCRNACARIDLNSSERTERSRKEPLLCNRQLLRWREPAPSFLAGISRRRLVREAMTASTLGGAAAAYPNRMRRAGKEE